VQQVLDRLYDDARGFAALEYTLITVIIGAVVLSGAGFIGSSLENSYTVISGVLLKLASAGP
jgi:Flp pilus assembly pilin Flp